MQHIVSAFVVKCYILLNPYLSLGQLLVLMTFALQDCRSPLYSASFNGHLAVVKTLIEAGAFVDQVSKVGTCIF